MPILVEGLRIPLGEDQQGVVDEAIRRAGLRTDEVASVEIARQSVDRRRRTPIVCLTLELHLKDETRADRLVSVRGVRRLAPQLPAELVRGDAPLPHRPVIIGTGPAGFFAAWRLALCGYAPLVLERGDAMNLRVGRIRDLNRDGMLDPESNYLFGEGGAGTFSDGKLTCRSKDPRARQVLDVFREKSGVGSAAYHYRPHLGSERVRTVVGRLRSEILAHGGTIAYRCRAESFQMSLGRLEAVATSQGLVPATVCVLAAGHSARDLYGTLVEQGIALERKPFQLGLRVEHPQDFVDRAVYGRAQSESLGPADYRLLVDVRGRSVFSFCMCPGGEIIPAVSDLAHMNTNGMSHTKKTTGFANSGVVTTVEPADFPGVGPLAGLALQAELEQAAARAVEGSLAIPAQRLVDFLARRRSKDLPTSSSRVPLRAVALHDLLPPALGELLQEGLLGMNRQMRGFLQPDALVVGPESRSSAPVRILRDPDRLVSPSLDGLYPVGEGAGYAGGIVSAAIDGLRAAEAILARYAAPRS